MRVLVTGAHDPAERAERAGFAVARGELTDTGRLRELADLAARWGAEEERKHDHKNGVSALERDG